VNLLPGAQTAYRKLRPPESTGNSDGVSSRFIRENAGSATRTEAEHSQGRHGQSEDRETIDALRVATSADVVVYTADSSVLSDYISKFFSQEPQNISSIIEDMGEKGIEFLREEEEDVGHLKDLASRSPDNQDR